MARKNGNLLCLDLNALRRTARKDDLATPGVGRRAFLAGAAVVAASATGAGRAAAKAVSFGSLRVKKKSDRAGRLRSVTIGVDGRHAWTLDASLFDGDPEIVVEETSDAMTVRMEEAFLPGTRFQVNLEARITQTVLSRKVDFKFTRTGTEGREFAMSADFDAWVRAEADASASLAREDLEAVFGGGPGLNAKLSLVPEGSGKISFLPSSGFAANGCPYSVRTNGRSLPLAGIVLLPDRNENDAIVSNAANVTRLYGSQHRNWKGRVEFRTPEGWIGAGSLKGFDRIEAELHSPESALVVLDGDGPFDLRAGADNGMGLQLDRARLVTLAQPGHQTEVLAAKIHEKGAWLDLSGVSIEIGPRDEDAEAIFARIESPEGEATYADIQGGIRNASFPLEGAITRTRVNGIEPISLLAWTGQGTRPPVTIQRPPTGATPSAGIGQAGRLDLTAVPKFRLAPFQLEVVRKEDMLALTFEFVNLAFQGGGQATLVRADTTKPSYIAVIFPPQSLAEAAYDEDVNGNPKPSANAGPTRRPIPSRLSGESRLVFFIPSSVPNISFSIKGEDGKGRNGLLDWKRWSPSITATAVSSYGGPKIRVDAAHISPLDSVTVKTRDISRVGIQIRPPDEPEADPGLVQSLRRLTAKRGPSIQGAAVRPTNIATQPQTRVNVTSQLGRVAANVNPTLVFKFIPKNRIEPNALHTQIEMPVRLIISPNENAGWAHAFVLPQNPPSNRYALWHTRLGNKVDGPSGQEDQILLYSDDGKTFYRQTSAGAEGPFPLPTRAGPTIRAIDAVDYGISHLPPVIPDITQGGFHQLYHTYPLDRKELVDNMCWRGEGSADSEPFEVSNLILTSLGGYLKGEWTWRTPTGWNRQLPQLISWRHISTLGRDHYVKLVKRGFLFPTGHKAVMIETTERKFNVTTEGKVVAYLRRRKFVVVRDPLIQLNANETRALGFSSLTCLTKETPILDPLVGGLVASPWNIQQDQKLQWLYSGGTPVMFQMRGVDAEGKTHQWSMPSLFVYSNVNDSAEITRVNQLIQAYNNADNAKKIPLGFPNRAKVFGQTVAFAPGGGKTPSGEDAEGNTAFPVNDMLISAVRIGGDAGGWMVDQARWRPVLFKANITAPAVQMMQGKPPSLGAFHMPGEMFDMEQLQASMEAESMMYAGDDGFDVKIPEVFKQSGFGTQNKSQMFLELVEKYAPKFGDTSKSGGIVNPNMIIQGLSKGKGPIGGDLNEILNGEIDPKKLMDTGARLLGAVKIFDLLPNPIKIDPGGPESPYIEILMIYDDGKNKPPTGAKVAIIWKPPLQNWGFPNEPPLFYVKNFKSPNPGFPGAGELKLEGSIKTKFKGGSKPEMVFKGHVINFRVDLISPASFLLLDFRKIEFIAEVGKPFDTNIDLSKMTFVGPLTFIQKLQDLLNGGGQGMQVISTDPNADLVSSVLSTADPGIDVFFDVDETGIRAGLTITVPSVSVGMLAIRNISVGVKLVLPFFGDPLSVRFNFCERNNTFQISVMMVTGGGFVAMEINIDGMMTFEAAFEFGGSLSFDIGVASGGVSIMAGIYFRLESKDGYTQCMVEAYIRLQGNLSVLGLIRISLEFYLSLTYYSDGNRLIGTATLTVEIEILFFSISVSLTVQRQIAGEKSGGSYFFASNLDELPMADETTKFTEVVTQAQWVEYCEAFA